jgi:hypothetical protein
MEAKSRPGASFSIRRVSFGRRLELARKIRELDRRLEFLKAGDDAVSKVEAAIVSREVDRVYLSWGLASVEGVLIDGEPATPETLVESGPEDLTQEILEAIKAECFLSEEERKN